MSLVCDHENPARLGHVLAEWLKIKEADTPLDTAYTDSATITCGVCGAKVQASIHYAVLKKGKSRKSNRLWALLRGVG